jgi:tetratricopeptide (TPR) repeat protein
MSQGDVAAARRCLEQAIEAGRVDREVNRPTFARLLNKAASLASDMGDLHATEAHLRLSIQVHRAMGDADHPGLAAALRHLARLEHGRGDYRRSWELAVEALDIYKRLTLKQQRGEFASAVVAVLQESADTLVAVGRYPQARERLEQALGIRGGKQPDTHPDVVANLEALGRVCALLEDWAAATQYLTRALPTLRRELGPSDPRVVEAENVLANAESQLRRRAN